MNKPTCRLCGGNHWNTEPHAFDKAQLRAATDAIIARKPVRPNTQSVRPNAPNTPEPVRPNTEASKTPRIDTLERELAALRAEVARLTERLRALEGRDAKPVTARLDKEREYQREYMRKRRAKDSAAPA